MRKLTLFIPGLFGPDSDTLPGFTPEIPAIENHFRVGSLEETNTRKSTHRSSFADDFTGTLFQLFGFAENKQDYPVAAVTRLVDDDHELDGYWLRADPVHLRAERDAVVLMDDSAFNLEKHEALILAADLQQVFTERDIELQAPTNNRWYIKLKYLPEITTVPIHDVVGDDIHQNLSVGKDKTLWDQLNNEAQMCLHNCPLNDEREQRGELPVNGVWLWGAGALPDSQNIPDKIWTSVFADEVTTQGLSVFTGSSYHDLPDSIAALMAQTSEQDNILAVISFGLRHQHYFDHQGWQDFIIYLEQEWFVGIETLIKQREIDELVLLTGRSKLTVTKASFMKFWRRRKPINAYRK